MPYLNLQILPGATTPQKRAVVRDFTRTLVKRLGKRPEHIHIVIQEIAPDNWGYSGRLTSELNVTSKRKRRS